MIFRSLFDLRAYLDRRAVRRAVRPVRTSAGLGAEDEE